MKKEKIYEAPNISLILLVQEQQLLTGSENTWQSSLNIGDDNELGEY